MFEIISLLALGLVFGFKHAFDADHLAAVALLTSQSKSMKQSLLHSIYWGVGHTAALLFAGILIIGFKIYFPEAAMRFLEFFVGLILFFLGTKTLFDFWRQKVSKENTHFTHHHFPFGSHHHPYPSFFVGLVHGFAGSAALLLLVLGTLQSVFWGIVYVLVFGIGSTTGMILVGAAVGLSGTRIKKYLNLSAGVFSFCLGLFMMATTTIF